MMATLAGILFSATVAAQTSSSPVVNLLSGLSFGNFAAPSGSSVKVSETTGACTPLGGAAMIRPTCSRGLLEIMAAPGDQIMLSFPAQAILENQSGGGNLVLEDFTFDQSSPFMVPAQGSIKIGMGATAKPSGQLKGGTFSGVLQIDATILK